MLVLLHIMPIALITELVRSHTLNAWINYVTRNSCHFDSTSIWDTVVNTSKSIRQALQQKNAFTTHEKSANKAKENASSCITIFRCS